MRKLIYNFISDFESVRLVEFNSICRIKFNKNIRILFNITLKTNIGKNIRIKIK